MYCAYKTCAKTAKKYKKYALDRIILAIGRHSAIQKPYSIRATNMTKQKRTCFCCSTHSEELTALITGLCFCNFIFHIDKIYSQCFKHHTAYQFFITMARCDVIFRLGKVHMRIDHHCVCVCIFQAPPTNVTVC